MTFSHYGILIHLLVSFNLYFLILFVLVYTHTHTRKISMYLLLSFRVLLIDFSVFLLFAHTIQTHILSTPIHPTMIYNSSLSTFHTHKTNPHSSVLFSFTFFSLLSCFLISFFLFFFLFTFLSLHAHTHRQTPAHICLVFRSRHSRRSRARARRRNAKQRLLIK
jgi:hypothetical protein